MPAEALRVLTDTGTAPIDEGAVAVPAAYGLVISRAAGGG